MADRVRPRRAGDRCEPLDGGKPQQQPQHPDHLMPDIEGIMPALAFGEERAVRGPPAAGLDVLKLRGPARVDRRRCVLLELLNHRVGDQLLLRLGEFAPRQPVYVGRQPAAPPDAGYRRPQLCVHVTDDHITPGLSALQRDELVDHDVGPHLIAAGARVESLGD